MKIAPRRGEYALTRIILRMVFQEKVLKRERDN